CADLQLAARRLLLVVDECAIEPAYAGGVHPQREAGAIDRPFVAGQVVRPGELEPHVGGRRARLARGEAHAQPRDALALDQAVEVRLRRFGDFDHGAILASPTGRRLKTCPTSFPSTRPIASPAAAASTGSPRRNCANCSHKCPAGSLPKAAKRWCGPSPSRTTTARCRS